MNNLWLSLAAIILGAAVLVVDHMVGDSVHAATPAVATSFTGAAVALAARGR